MMMKIRQQFTNNKGFTLVELMVVIAILGILAAIAVPRFTSASESARGAKIAADLRTIDSAVQMAVANGTYTTGTASTTIPAAVLVFLTGTPATPPAGSAIRRSAANGGAAATTTLAAYGIDATGRAVLDGHTAEWY